MSWISFWTIRFVVVVLGIFCVMLALDLLGLNNSENPFTSWHGLVQALALSLGVCALLAIDLALHYFGFIVDPPVRIDVSGPENGHVHEGEPFN